MLTGMVFFFLFKDVPARFGNPVNEEFDVHQKDQGESDEQCRGF